MSTLTAYTIPTTSSPSSGTWSSVYTTGSGGTIVDLNGVGYGELLNSQTGESLCINSITIQPYSSSTFDLAQRIAQLLQPLKFTKKLAYGKDRSIVINPTVDMYQNSTTLKHINLGKEANNFIFDGTTRFTVQLLPYATINFQFKYTKLTNFVFGYKDLVNEVIRMNNKRNKEEMIKSKLGKSYLLNL